MDISIDTLIYIIIGIIFVLAQFARKRNIKKAPPPAPVEPAVEEKQEDIKDFWREFLGVPESPEPERKFDVPSRLDTVPPVDHDTLSFLRSDPGKKESVRHLGHSEPDSASEKGRLGPAVPPDPERDESPFDLRSAVIYSAILERKYV